MVARPCYDWSPLGYGSHPLPGDSDEITRGAREFRRTASHLRTAAQGLTRLEAGSETESKAIDALDDDMRDILSVLWDALDRYEDAAGALEGYAPVLLRAQEQAEAALRAAAESRSEYQQAAREANNARSALLTTLDPDQRRELLRTYHHAKGRASTANGNLIGARDQVEDAKADVVAAGNTAADLISSAIKNSGLNDTLADKLAEIGGKVVEFFNSPMVKAIIDGIAAAGKWVWENIDSIALGLTVLAVATAWIPGLNVVTAALAVAARVAAVISRAKLAVDIGTAVLKNDWKQLAVLGGSFLLGKRLGNAVKKVEGAITKKLFQDMARRSQALTGSMNKATSAATEGVGTPTYHGAHQLLHVVEDKARRVKADALLATFKGTDYSGALHRDVVIMAAVGSEVASKATDFGVNKAVDAIADAVAPDRHEVCRQPVGAVR